jgi:hypothetical protein
VGVGHSILLVLWLENSILAFVAGMMLTYFLIQVLMQGIMQRTDLSPVIVLVGTALAWDLLFSPLSTTARMQFGMVLALYVLNYPGLKNVNSRRASIHPMEVTIGGRAGQ